MGPARTKRRIAPARSRAGRAAFIAATMLFACFAGLLLSEIALRFFLAKRYGESLADISPDIPADPEREISLGQLIRADPDPEVVFGLKPGAVGKFVGQEVRINSRGFRGPEWPDKKTSDTLRIVALGDSTMFGWGVKEEERYADLLNGMAQKALGGRAAVETVNVAAPAYMAIQEAVLAERHLPELKPDAVVIHYDPNDIYVPPFLNVPNYMEWDRIYLFHWRAIARGTFASEIFWGRVGPGSDPRILAMNGWEPLTEAYRRLRDLCANSGVPLLAVLAFWSEGDEGGIPPQDWMMDICKSLGIRAVDTRTAAREFAAANGIPVDSLSLDFPADAHPTPVGHRVMADAAFPELLKMLAPGRLSEADLDVALAAAGEARMKLAERGLYPASDWGNGVLVRWMGAEAQAVFVPEGEIMTVPFLTAAHHCSAEKPLRVTMQAGSLPAQTMAIDKDGYYEMKLDVAALPKAPAPLRISVDRVIRENADGTGREIGIAVYPLKFGPR